MHCYYVAKMLVKPQIQSISDKHDSEWENKMPNDLVLRKIICPFKNQSLLEIISTHSAGLFLLCSLSRALTLVPGETLTVRGAFKLIEEQNNF